MLVLGYWLFVPNNIFAQNINSLGIAQHINLTISSGQEIKDGMIVSLYENSYQLAKESYDKAMVGVANLNPALEFTLGEGEVSTPVIKSGNAPVLVTAKNGAISRGSAITSSGTPGIGMLADKTGFILGTALEDFAPANPDDQGLVMVSLDIKFSFAADSPDSEKIGRRLLDIVSVSAIAAVDDPRIMLQYVVASLIFISSVATALLVFARISQKGIEALGRNPLASHVISMGILLNVIISGVIVLAGAFISYFIVKL